MTDTVSLILGRRKGRLTDADFDAAVVGDTNKADVRASLLAAGLLRDTAPPSAFTFYADASGNQYVDESSNLYIAG